MTPARALAKARPLREDHLGASTFIEKGWHQIAQGDFTAAEATLERALRLAPSDRHARALLGMAIMRQGRYDDALVILDEVVAEDAMHGMARVSLGYVCMRKGLLREAHEHMRRAESQLRDPKARLYGCFYLGLLYSQQRDVVESERCFQRTLSLAPNFIEAYYEMGRMYWCAGEVAEAERAWRAGNAANRFSDWGKKCAEAIRLTRAGQEPLSFS